MSIQFKFGEPVRVRTQRWLLATSCLLFSLFASASGTSERGIVRPNPPGDRYEHSIALRLPYGDGPAAVKFLPDGDDERARGPVSFAIEGNSILILDSEHGRILDFDRNGSLVRSIADVQGHDIATDSSAIFVLDATTETVTRIALDGTRSTVQGLPSDVIRLATTHGTVGYEHEGRFVSLPHKADFEVQEGTVSPSDVDINGYDYRDIDTFTGTIRNKKTGLTLTIRTKMPLGSMNVIGSDNAENTFVAVEQLFDDGAGTGVAKEIRKFAPDGRLRVVIPINIDYAAHPVREFVVTPDGSLYHLLPLPTVLLVEEWHEQ